MTIGISRKCDWLNYVHNCWVLVSSNISNSQFSHFLVDDCRTQLNIFGQPQPNQSVVKVQLKWVTERKIGEW